MCQAVKEMRELREVVDAEAVAERKPTLLEEAANVIDITKLKNKKVQGLAKEIVEWGKVRKTGSGTEFSHS
jgi:hypothetical protein